MTRNRKRSKNARNNSSVFTTSKTAPNPSLLRQLKSIAFESLENRQLLAVINVSDFGAVPNDGRDDRGAIQNAINASAAGDTINFGNGQYNLGGGLELRGDRQYIGNSTTLKWNGGAGHVASARGVRNLTIKGFTAEGAGFKLETTSNVQFTDNVVKNVTSGDAWVGNGLLILDEINDSNILRNRFENIGHRGIYFFSPNRTKVEDNTFINCYQGWSGAFFKTSTDTSFSYNTVVGALGYGGELQNYGTVSGLKVSYNHLSGWRDARPNWTRSPNGISIAMGNNSSGMIVEGNVLIADGAIPTMIAQGVPRHYFTALELMGKGFIVRNNYGEGWGWWQLVGHNDANWQTNNNTWLAAAHTPIRPGIGVADGSEIVPEAGWGGGPASKTGNYYGKIGDKPRPVAGARTGTGNPNPNPNPTPNPNPNPNPTPDPTPAPGPNAATELTGRALSTSSIELKWKDNSTNELNFVVERKTTRGADAWVAVKTLAANSTTFTDTGLNPSWEYDYRIAALGANNTVSRSAQITAQTQIPPNPNPTPDPTPDPNPNPNPNPTPDPNPTPTTINAPSELKGQTLSTTAIRLTWKDNSNNEFRFRIERRATRGSEDYATVATLMPGTTHYADRGLIRTWEYDYRIVAVAEDGTIARSAPITVQTHLTEPIPPNVGNPDRMPRPVGGLTGVALNVDRIRLVWSDTNRNETGYRVERKTAQGGDSWNEVVTLPAGSKVYVDKNLAQTWQYNYRIITVNPWGEIACEPITVQTMMSRPENPLTHVQTLPIIKSTNGMGPVEINMSNGGEDAQDGTPLAIGGKGYFRGLGVHANSEVRYELGGKFKTFMTDIGVDDSAGRKGSVIFQIWADGDQLFQSSKMTGGQKAVSVEVPVDGRKELWLVVNDAGDGNDMDLADWGNPRLAA